MFFVKGDAELGSTRTTSMLDSTSKPNGSATSNAVESQQPTNVNISNTNQPLQAGSAQTAQKSKENNDAAIVDITKNGIFIYNFISFIFIIYFIF